MSAIRDERSPGDPLADRLKPALRTARRWLRRRCSDEEAADIRGRRFPLVTSLLVLALILLSVADAVFTLMLLDGRFEEANPAMKFLLDRGPTAFLIGKYLMTVIGIPFLIVYRRRPIFVPWLRVGHLIPIFVGCYVLLVIYQIGLLGGT